MKLSIAIIDDAPTYAGHLKGLVCEWFDACKIPVDIKLFHNAKTFLSDFFKTGKWSLIISDVSMPEMNGMELARKIREVDKHIPIIFVSSFIEFSLQGYEVNAVRYLHKEAANFKDNLYEGLSAVQKALQRKPEEFLSFKCDNKFHKLAYSDIYYFEQCAHMVKIHTEKETPTYRSSMKELIASLPSYFVVTSRSYIVNMREVISITNSGVVLRNKETVPLTQGNRPNVIKMFKEEEF